jgi:zinc/manganese transport system substrate-binding protein
MTSYNEIDSHYRKKRKSTGGSSVKRLLGVAVVLAMAVTSCGGDDEPAAGNGPPLVVATTNILGDAVASALGDSVRVEVLIPADTDPHAFTPSPEQVALLRSADLVVANGLGLEEGLDSVLDAARDDGRDIVEAGSLVEPLSDTETDSADPHFWFDPLRMRDALDGIQAEVARIAPDAAAATAAALAAYQGRLASLDDELRALVDGVAPDRRLLVTNHDALAYLADAYGFRIVGTVIPGATTLAQPSAADLAELARAIVDNDVPAIFADTSGPTRLAEVVADETGRDIAVVELYTGSLGPPGSEAETYEGFVRTAVTRIVAALGG